MSPCRQLASKCKERIAQLLPTFGKAKTNRLPIASRIGGSKMSAWSPSVPKWRYKRRKKWWRNSIDSQIWVARNWESWVMSASCRESSNTIKRCCSSMQKVKSRGYVWMNIEKKCQFDEHVHWEGQKNWIKCLKISVIATVIREDVGHEAWHKQKQFEGLLLRD